MPDPHEAPEDETPGQRRARLMNLNNPAWKPEKVEPKVDEMPPPETSTIEDDPQPKPPAEPVSEPKRQSVQPSAKDK